MSDGLYRPIAVKALALNEQLGRTLQVPARVVDWALLGGVLTLLALGGLAYGFSYEARTTVNGYLEPIAGLVNVKAPQEGVVRRIAVKEGVVVEEGQILFLLDTAVGTRSHSSQTELIAGTYSQEIADLQSRSQLYRRRLRTETELLTAERKSLTAGLLALNARRTTLQRQRDLRQQHLQRLEQLAEGGLVAVSDVGAATELLHVTDGELALAAMERASLHGRVARTELELHRLETNNAIDQSSLATTLRSLQRQLMENAPRIEIAIRAPITGTISAPQIVDGQRIVAGTATMSILASQELRAVLLVPSHAAGFIEPGQTVQIRYDAFAYEKYGVHRGLVKEVSGSTLQATDGTAAYRVLVGLRPTTESIHLRPGMTLQADLLRDRRRLYEWLLAPALQLSTSIARSDQDA